MNYFNFSSQQLRNFLLTTILIINQGCYHYHVSTANFDPGTDYQTKTVYSMFWGLGQRDIIASNCDSLKIKSLDEVKVTTNFAYAFITVATLGICSPMKIEWKCSKPCQREGEIP